MKEKYIELMDKVLSAYSIEHILRYFDDVKTNGLTEHGFPRLTANIGILISHGRRHDLLPIFLEMMEFCCKTIPCVKAANDFSVREIVCCIREVERSGIVDAETVERWKGYLATIEPTTCYNVFAVTPADNVRNWALFTGVSEFFRQQMGLCDSMTFIDTQIASQFQWLDENGMYMDNKQAVNHQPIMYDLVPRGLFVLLLQDGYRGCHYEKIDAFLKKSALLTLKMQSPTGEMAFGGRSNQFLHNEAWMITVYEFEACRYAREGNIALAGEFKAAIKRAISVTEYWLEMDPILHIKNRFPTESFYGCEKYAYFDKYMITAASNLYAAYLVCDDTIPTPALSDIQPTVFQTTEYFHKLFLKSGGYGLEIDLDADPQYDASGLGRVHRVGAPSAICMSVPCPAAPKYHVDLDQPMPLALCPAVYDGEAWCFGAESDVKYEVVQADTTAGDARASVTCYFPMGRDVTSDYCVNGSGVAIGLSGTGKIGYLLPAFSFDGETEAQIDADENSLTVRYKGWLCRYTVEGGQIEDLDRMAANRNGHYLTYLAVGTDSMRIGIEIVPVEL